MDKVVVGADQIKAAMDKETTGVDLRVANKVMVNKARVDGVAIKEVLVVKAMVAQLDNQAVIVWATTTHKKVVDNRLMVVEDGVVSKDSLRKGNLDVRANQNPVHHHKKERMASKIREIKTRTGIAKA